MRRFDKFLQFYKLHGSIHWSFDDKGLCRAQHRDLSFAQEYRGLKPQEKAKMLDEGVRFKVKALTFFRCLERCKLTDYSLQQDLTVHAKAVFNGKTK